MSNDWISFFGNKWIKMCLEAEFKMQQIILKKEGRAVDFFLLTDFMRNICPSNKHCRINRTLSIPITQFLICVSELGLSSRHCALIEIIKFCPKIMKSFLIFRDWILFWFKPWLLGDYLSKVNIWKSNVSNNLD